MCPWCSYFCPFLYSVCQPEGTAFNSSNKMYFLSITVFQQAVFLFAETLLFDLSPTSFRRPFRCYFPKKPSLTPLDYVLVTGERNLSQTDFLRENLLAPVTKRSIVLYPSLVKFTYQMVLSKMCLPSSLDSFFLCVQLHFHIISPLVMTRWPSAAPKLNQFSSPK